MSTYLCVTISSQDLWLKRDREARKGGKEL